MLKRSFAANRVVWGTGEGIFGDGCPMNEGRRMIAFRKTKLISPKRWLPGVNDQYFIVMIA